MNRLFIAGDSFASLSKDQQIGNSWSELLANELNLELVNLARPASSNFAIALQIEWIAEHIKKDDFVVVFLTDSYRKTLVDLTIPRDQSKHILETQVLHKDQRQKNALKYSEKPRLINSIMDHSGDTKSYYRDWFDIEAQEIEDRLVITGSLARLSQVSNKFKVCKGGFGKYRNRNRKNAEIDHNTFCIGEHQFADYSVDYLTSLSVRTIYINHLDDITHKKFAILMKKELSG